MEGISSLFPRDDYRASAFVSYLTWEFAKAGVRAALDDPSPSVSVNRVIDYASRGLVEKSLNHVDLVRSLSPGSNRAQLLVSLSWTEEEYPTSQLGTVLPLCGDFSPEILVKNLPSVVEFVRDSSPSQRANSRSLRYIFSLAKAGAVLNRVPPLVVEPGSLQRNETVMKSYYGRSFVVESGSGYVEDGNHRAIATILATNQDKIRALVGRRIGSCQS